MTLQRHMILALFVFTLALGFGLPAMAQSSSGVSPNVLMLPKGPGSLGGIGENVQTNLNMGLMSYAIKVIVPSGRGSATPNPSITYSSGGGTSLLGIGWNFSAGSRIERMTARGLPKYDNTDLFFAGKELVKLPKAPFYRHRYEGSFARYRWVQVDVSDQRGYWIAEYPDGTKKYYGANSKGQIVQSAQIYGLKGTFCWELVTMVDRNGNRVEYTYKKFGSKTYPDEISWVFDTQGSPLYKLQFTYEDRNDHISDGKPGFDLQTTKRLKEIQITSGGSRFRSYSFAFEDTTGLSRLTKVTRYGREAGKAYPIQFSMQYSDALVSNSQLQLVTMPTSLGVDFKSGNADFLDINGDGLPDIVDTSNPKHVFHINQLKLDKDWKQVSHDFPASLQSENPKQTSAQLKNPTVQMLDANGDGFTDMVDAVNMQIYINKGNGQWENNNEALQSFPVTGKNPNMRFFDYDGDKKIDVISVEPTLTQYWVNDGKGNWIPTAGNTQIGLSMSKDKLRLIDINGDGLQDIVHVTKDKVRYRKYLGYGEWTDWIEMVVADIEKYPLTDNAQFQDINGDGMADMVIIVGSSIVYFVNQNGNRFANPQTLNTGGMNIPDASQATIRIVDINGNGSRDIVWLDSSGKVSYLELFDKRPNLMTAISNGIGQRINIKYGSSVHFYLRDKDCDTGKDKACAGPWKNKMPMAFTVVTNISTWASREQEPAKQAEPAQAERPRIQSVFYHHGFYDGSEKKFRGYQHVETLFDGDTSMLARKDELKYDVGDTDKYMHGKLLMQSTTDASGNSYYRQENKYADCPVELGGIDGKTLPFQIRFTCAKSQETTTMEGLTDQAKWQTTKVEWSYDGYGNQILSHNYGFIGKTGDEKVTKTTYVLPQNPNDIDARWLLRFPARVENCSTLAGPCSLSEFYYDGDAYNGLPLAEITKGNLSRVRLREADGKFIEPIRNTYDEYGNLVGSKTAVDQLRTYEWDSTYKLFPEKEVMHLNEYQLVISTIWDYAQSKVLQSTDVNGQVKRYTYDSFGRLTQTFQESDPTDKPSLRYTYRLQAPLSTITTEVLSKVGGAYERTKIECFDGLNRMVAVVIRSSQDKSLVLNHREYNREGKLARLWHNYESSDSDCKFTAPPSVPSKQLFYDGLARKVRTELADGSMARVVYEPFKRIVYDFEDSLPSSPHYETPTTFVSDGLGRVIEKITMPAKGQTITTKFAYSNANTSGANLTTAVTFADGSVKKQEFDQLGRLRKLIDPDRSTTIYNYRADNMLTSVTDARGTETLFTYDGLQRILHRQEAGKDDTKVTFQYDQLSPAFKEATFLKGRLVRIQYPGGQKLYSYDERGNAIQVLHVMMGHTFGFKSNYNNVNERLSTTYPDGRVLTSSYDNVGRLVSITGKIKNIQYNAFGLREKLEWGNGVAVSYGYDKRIRPYQFDVGDGKVMSLEYLFDAEGNPTQIQQTHGNESFKNTYTYDSLYRLTQANIHDSKEILRYKQDDLHNMTQKSSSLNDKSPAHIGDYAYDKEKVHAATKAGKYTLEYDKAGNVTKRNDVALQWDYMHRISQASNNGAVIAKYWYGSGHRRTIKQENGIYTFYIGANYELREGAIVSYIRMGLDRKVASWTTNGVAAFFDDADKDGHITSADAWLYHAKKEGFGQATLKQRPFDLNLTKTMLLSSAHRMLLEDKEVNHYYHSDLLGNVRAVTDDSGQVIQRKHYHPYGTIVTQSGQGQVFSYGYQGTEYDKALGVWVYLKRSLDPRIGRWLSADPEFARVGGINDEFNSYGMVQSNPITFRDELGTSAKKGIVAGLIVATAGAATFTVGLAAAVATQEQSWALTSMIGAATMLTGIAVGALATGYGFIKSHRAMQGAVDFVKATRKYRTENPELARKLDKSYAQMRNPFPQPSTPVTKQPNTQVQRKSSISQEKKMINEIALKRNAYKENATRQIAYYLNGSNQKAPSSSANIGNQKERWKQVKATRKGPTPKGPKMK